MQGQPRRSRARAFTLIEILVVVAIIALLISILLPSLSRAKAQAKAVVCQSNIRQIELGLFIYQRDHRGYLPWTLWSEYDWNFPTMQDRALKCDLWFYKLHGWRPGRKYVGDPKVFICAADPFGSSFQYLPTDASGPTPAGFDASTAIKLKYNVPSCGYGMNYVLRHAVGWMSTRPSYNIEAHPPKRPANTILLGEVGPDTRLVNVPLGEGMGQPWRDGGRILWDDGSHAGYSGPTWLTTRHFGGINMLAMDGSVHRARTAEILRTKGIAKYYDDCAAGGCLFCNYADWSNPHYNFAPSKLWWWTGPAKY